MTEEDQLYAARLIEAHGDDYRKMSHDMEKNYMQHGEARLKSMVRKYIHLDEEWRRVPLPENFGRKRKKSL